MTVKGNYLNGEWKVSSREIEVYANRENGKLIGKFSIIGKEEIDKIVKNSKEAFEDWSQLSIKERGNYLLKIADILEDKVDNIAEILSQDVSKGYNAAKQEILRSADYIRFTVEEALHLNFVEYLEGNVYDVSSKDRALVRNIPVGVVLAISPFNYPINLAVSKIIPALITGNTVIFKPATEATLTGIALVEVFEAAKLPKGVVNTAIGKGSEIGDYLNEHQGIDFIHFTGSTGVGTHITNVAGLKGLNMELGGKDSALVLDDANLKLAAGEIVQGAYNYSGQRCTGIKRVFVTGKIEEELINNIKEEIQKLKIGYPEDSADVVPVINKGSADYIEDLYNDAVNKGAKIITPFKRDNNLISPILLTNVTADMKLAWEEPFGPILPIIIVKDEKEMIEIANKSEFGLQSSIFTNNKERAFKIAQKLEVGTVHINKKTQRGPDNFPFLGVKGSGVGVQGIKDSILSMTRKLVIVDKEEK